MEGKYDKTMVSLKRFRTQTGTTAYNVMYGDVVVGKIGKNPNGYGNPWLGFLFSEGATIAGGAGSEAKTVQSATVRALELNFETVTAQPTQKQQAEPQIEVAVASESAEDLVQSGMEHAVTAFAGGPTTPRPTPQSRPQVEPKTAKAQPDPTYCLCGCEAETKPKSKFRQGHDAKVKGLISRAIQSLEPDYRHSPNAAPLSLPKILVDRARVDADFQVAGHTAPAILDLAEKVGIK